MKKIYGFVPEHGDTTKYFIYRKKGRGWTSYTVWLSSNLKIRLFIDKRKL